MEVTQGQRETAVGIDAIMDRKQKNTLPLYGNKETMNLNSMILTNVQGSPYFKEDLYQFKTFHEVVDEIYYKVSHLEPWERNSRKLAGQVGMCGGVRGVAAGGIVSTAFCLLYKLFTLKLTRRQLTSLINHRDSPYIRALGFLYIRYCQPPADFWDWMGPYLDDEEEIDLKAGGGYQVTIGEVVRMLLSKLEWFGTLFPRIPLNVQKVLEDNIKQAKMAARLSQNPVEPEDQLAGDEQENGNFPADEWGEAGRRAKEDAGNSGSKRSRSRERRRSRSRSPRRRSRERDRRERDRDRSRERRGRSRDRRERRGRSRERSRERKGRSRSRERRRRSSRERPREMSRERRERSRGRSRERRGRSRSREQRRQSRDRSRDKERKQSPSHERGRERSRSRNRRSHSRDRARSRDRIRR